jgi:hypothetical protein
MEDTLHMSREPPATVPHQLSPSASSSLPEQLRHRPLHRTFAHVKLYSNSTISLQDDIDDNTKT